MVARPCHRTQEAPTPTRVIPSTAPTIACVVDTGMPANEAASRNSAPARIADAIPALWELLEALPGRTACPGVLDELRDDLHRAQPIAGLPLTGPYLA